MYKAAIIGISGHSVSDRERELFEKYKPAGFILFSRNIKDKEQVKNLVMDLRSCIGNPHAPILIDQEGGRVARLKGNNWYSAPAASVFGKIASENMEDARRAAYLNAMLIGKDLAELGISMNCAPVVDIPVEGAHDVIGDRAFSANKETITTLAQATIDGFISAGVSPIIKHIPGHGRAEADSHLSLPIVDASLEVLEENDFYPFKHLKDAEMAMTAHILYSSIDPTNPATQSPSVIKIIREEIKFDGLIISDCLSMKALKGSIPEIASKTIEAGVEIILYSKEVELEEMLEALPVLNEIQMKILNRLYLLNAPHSFNEEKVKNMLESILSAHGIAQLGKINAGYDPTESIL